MAQKKATAGKFHTAARRPAKKPTKPVSPAKPVVARATKKGPTAIIFDFSQMTVEQRITVCQSIIEQALNVPDHDKKLKIADAIKAKIAPVYLPGTLLVLKPGEEIARFVQFPDTFQSVKPEPVPVVTETPADTCERPAVSATVVEDAGDTGPAHEQPLPEADKGDETYAPPMPEHDIPESDPH